MYLSGFAQDGGVAVFDRRTGEIRRQTVDGTAVESHLYTFGDAEGRRRYDIEEMFCYIEAGMSNAIPRLLEAAAYAEEDIQYLLSFIAFAELRTPGALEDAKRIEAHFADTLGYVISQSAERTARILASMYEDKGEQRTPEELKAEAERVVKFVQDGNYSVEVNKQVALMRTLSLWRVLIDSFQHRDVLIIKPSDPSSRYVTCDSPVVLESSSGGNDIGFGSDDAIILFPLTSQCLISLSGSKRRIGRRSAGPEQVQRVNEILARSARRYVISEDEASLRQLTGPLQLTGTKPSEKYVVGREQAADGVIGFVRRTFPHREPPINLDSTPPQ
jgi:hypothetical protein